MKIQIFSIFSILCIELSKCQNIISPTNYTLSYLENVNMQQMSCKFDSDCPQYSKCESVTDGDKTYSLCKFGDFLCPEKTDGYFANSTINEYCVYVDATMYDLDEETVKEGFAKDIKPILKTCGFNDCDTEHCNKNSECFSGKCTNHKCINGDNLSYEVYRCSVNDQDKYSMKCKKVNGMKCGDNSECYSNKCVIYDIRTRKNDPFYCSNKDYKKGNGWTTVLPIIIIVIVVILIYVFLC